MWSLLRIVSMGGFLFALYKALQEQPSPHAGDLTPAFYMGLCVILAIIAAVSWAPYIGDKLSDPLTGAYSKQSHLVDPKNRLLKLIRWLDAKHYRRWTVLFCFLEGIRKPSAPSHFIIGLHNATPGSWLEKVYAREVFKFDNAQNCVVAYKILKEHGIDPRPHRNPEVNILLLSLEKSVQPTPAPLDLQKAPPPPEIKRNQRIELFHLSKPAPMVSAAEENLPG
jgi:hypothetical protein